MDKLISLILTIKDKSLLEDFLRGILTQKELEEIQLRLEIVKKLIKGEPQHKIAKELGVGVATVTRGSKELKLGRFKVLKKSTKGMSS